MKKREYVRKGFYYCFIFPFTWPFVLVKKSTINIKATADQTRKSLHEFQKPRDPWAEHAPDMTDFRQVLTHWGIRRDEIARVVSGLKAQMFIFALLGLWGIYNTTGSLTAILSGLPLIFLGSVIFITRLWRVQVLERHQFVYFKDWFLWGAFSWIGKETPIARATRLRKEHQNE